jgi:hypothetical protein
MGPLRHNRRITHLSGSRQMREIQKTHGAGLRSAVDAIAHASRTPQSNPMVSSARRRLQRFSGAIVTILQNSDQGQFGGLRTRLANTRARARVNNLFCGLVWVMAAYPECQIDFIECFLMFPRLISD